VLLTVFGLCAPIFAQEPDPDSTSVWEDAESDSLLLGEETEADSLGETEPDPLQLYLETLSDSAETSFDDPALEALSISDAEVDSLIRLYEATGNAPDQLDKKWRVAFGLSGVRYNRVEGVNVIPQVTVHAPTARRLELTARAGYGWSSHEATGSVEMHAELSRSFARPTLHGSWASDVYAYGSGIIAGNSLTALMLGEDYSDYFHGQGWDAGLQFYPGPFLIDLSYRAERQESLENAADFAVFEDDDDFRLNPPIDDGDEHRIQIQTNWSDWPQSPWTARAIGRISRPGLGSDFDYESVRGEVIHRHRLWLGDRIIASLAGGWAGGSPSFQAAHHLGGFELLRGYEVNEYTTREFGHARFDYELGWDPLHWVPFVRKLHIQPVVFGDAAAIFEMQDRQGAPIELDSPEWKFVTGAALQCNALGIPGGGAQIRFDVARRLDREDDAMTYRLRFALQTH
jgi:hypothetical protein